MTTVVAIVPAKDRADTIAATVRAVGDVPGVDRVLVVDDGSSDTTTDVARAAGAEVLRLPANRGKGGAVLAAVEATPGTDVYLLIDADLGATASVADQLLAPVLRDEADMTVGVLPSAGGRGGFGLVRDLAARGIKRASGFEAEAPLSGQRAVRAEYLQELPSAERFGLEVALTVDAVRAGARVLEVPVPMDHRHTGRTWAGFRHRALQGGDIVRSLWPRVTTSRLRIGILSVGTLAVLVAALWSGSRWVPTSDPLSDLPAKVVVFGMAPMGFADVSPTNTPNLDRLLHGGGAAAAMSVRTEARTPTLAEGYISLGAGFRTRSRSNAGEAYLSQERVGSGTAEQLLYLRSGRRADGDVAVVGAASSIDLSAKSTITSKPGALGEALEDAGRTAAVISNADRPGDTSDSGENDRPAALAVMDDNLSVATGTVDRAPLLTDDPDAPFGVRADPDGMMSELERTAERADVIMMDPGDLARAEEFRPLASARASVRVRTDALRSTDALLGRVLEWAGDDTIVMVTSVAPSGRSFRLTPFAMVGAGIEPGYVFSPSTKRDGVVALTDLAPTILHAAGAPIPDDMPGQALEIDPGHVDTDMLETLDRDTAFRERTYYPWAMWFIVFQAIVYLVGAAVLRRRSRLRRTGPLLRFLVLGAASFPLATFGFRMVPDWSAIGGAAWVVVLGMTIVIAYVASRFRRTPLSALNAIMAATVLVIAVDACTGTWLHVDSWLGYSLHSAGRFYGIPNTTYAVLAACALLLAASHVEYAPRRREAVLGASALLGLVVVIDGAPSLGGDVGGIVSLVPLFGLTLIALSGRRVRLRTVVLLALVTLAVLALATGIDLLRPEDARTHLGRFATSVIEDGPGEITDTFVRKQSANFRILRGSIWTWMIPIGAGFMLYVLVWERQWRDVLPTGSALRTGAIAVVAGALVGFLANDSGPVVIALFFVYLAPYLALLSLAGKQGQAVLLPPLAGPDPTGSPAVGAEAVGAPGA